MSSSDFAALAERYLDLWRRQAQANASDPATARTTDEFMRFFAAALNGLSAGKQDGHGQKQQSAADPEPEAGAAAARGAFRRSQPQLSDLLHRIAVLESRLDRLEACSVQDPGEKKSTPAPKIKRRNSDRRGATTVKSGSTRAERAPPKRSRP
jgi:hypothetical protein